MGTAKVAGPPDFWAVPSAMTWRAPLRLAFHVKA